MSCHYPVYQRTKHHCSGLQPDTVSALAKYIGPDAAHTLVNTPVKGQRHYHVLYHNKHTDSRRTDENAHPNIIPPSASPSTSTVTNVTTPSTTATATGSASHSSSAPAVNASPTHSMVTSTPKKRQRFRRSLRQTLTQERLLSRIHRLMQPISQFAVLQPFVDRDDDHDDDDHDDDDDDDDGENRYKHEVTESKPISTTSTTSTTTTTTTTTGGTAKTKKKINKLRSNHLVPGPNGQLRLSYMSKKVRFLPPPAHRITPPVIYQAPALPPPNAKQINPNRNPNHNTKLKQRLGDTDRDRDRDRDRDIEKRRVKGRRKQVCAVPAQRRRSWTQHGAAAFRWNHMMNRVAASATTTGCHTPPHKVRRLSQDDWLRIHNLPKLPLTPRPSPSRKTLRLAQAQR